MGGLGGHFIRGGVVMDFRAFRGVPWSSVDFLGRCALTLSVLCAPCINNCQR